MEEYSYGLQNQMRHPNINSDVTTAAQSDYFSYEIQRAVIL